MTTQRMLRGSALVLVFVLGATTPAFAQDPLAKAKGFYASAEYEEALTLLETLKGKASNTEAAAYQVFCLVALGRQDEARLAIESIVRTDPLFRPSETEASPRIRAFFDDVRKPLLFEVARQSYGRAKAAFDQKDWKPALEEFDRVIALLDELGGADQGVADLRTLSSGFRDLTRAALAPPKVVVPDPPVATLPAPPAPPPVVIYSDAHADVKRPVAIAKRIPEWRPSIVEEKMNFNGTIELIIDETGRVISVELIESVHPRFDAPLLAAAQAWTFRPATRNGVPVRYRYSLGVNLGK